MKLQPEVFTPAPLKAAVLPGLISFLACCLIRAQEASSWHAQYFIGDEPLMATHDAYAWMAGAKGTGLLHAAPLSEVLLAIHTLSGIQLGTIAFWLPMLMAPLVVVPLVCLCAWWARPEAGITAGVTAGVAYGFFFRTRLGYGDTDLFTLFLPLSFTVCLIALLSETLPGQWRKETSKNSGPAGFWARSAVVGMLAWLSHWFYPSGDIIIFSTASLGFALAGILGKREDRQKLIGGFALLAGFWLGGWLGFLPALLAVLLLKTPSPAWRGREGSILLGSVVLILLVNGQLYRSFHQTAYRLLWYGQWVTTTEQSIILPNRMLSVREAQPVEWSSLLSRIGVHWAFFSAGLAGYILLLRKRPMAIVLLPMLLLAIAGIKLGNRFTMYGGPAIGLGLGFFLSRILEGAALPKRILWAAHILLAGGVFAVAFSTATQLRPAPVLPRPYAEAMISLRTSTPPNAHLWQWWDYGYAAQYFAERWTMDDGARQAGLYPLALVHATPSALQASQMMKFSAATEIEQRGAMVLNGINPINPGAQILYYPTDPMLPLKEMDDPILAMDFVDTMARERMAWPADLPPQYLLLSWENLKLAYWITYFGNWDLAAGVGRPGRVHRLKERIDIDKRHGVLHTTSGQTPLAGLLQVGRGGAESHWWAVEEGLFLVVNDLNGESFLMGKEVFDSMMVRMLLGDPKEFSAYFELVEEGYPWVRVYRAR
jgi:undecaprenyl-diphosphooligosaccharide---protein glycotransferase